MREEMTMNYKTARIIGAALCPLAYGVAALSTVILLAGLAFAGYDSVVWLDLRLTLALTCLTLATSTAYLRREHDRWTLVGIGWAAWAVLGIALAGFNCPPGAFIPIGLLAVTISSIPLGVGAVLDIRRNFRPVWRPIAKAAAGVGLWFLLSPYVYALGLPWLSKGGDLRSLLDTAGGLPIVIAPLCCAPPGLAAAFLYLRRVRHRLETSSNTNSGE
jgi:hypothetical protein